MNSYEEKQENRKQRLTTRANQLARSAAQQLQRGFGGEDVTGIPMGQPILVGHHSEGRHRRALERQDQLVRRGIADLDESKRLQHAAEAVGTAGVSSDDPDALGKLKQNLHEAEARHAELKAARKRDPRLVEAFTLTNSAARIRNMRGRIEELERRRQDTTTEETVGSVRLVDDVDANRMRFYSETRLSSDITSELKSNGFRWAPSEACWQRHRSPRALYVARMIAKKTEPARPPA